MFHHYILKKIVWAVTALAAIHLGLMPLGYNIFTAQMFMNYPGFVDIVHYFIGLCGLYSLINMIMHVMGYCNSCDKKKR